MLNVPVAVGSAECQRILGWWQDLAHPQPQKTDAIIWTRPKAVLFIRNGGAVAESGCLKWLCDIGRHPVLSDDLCSSLSDGMDATLFWNTIEKLWERGGVPGRQLARRAALLKRHKVRGKLGWTIGLAVLGPILLLLELLRLAFFRERGGVLMVAEPIVMLGGGASCLIFAAILFATACRDYWRSREYLTGIEDSIVTEH